MRCRRYTVLTYSHTAGGSDFRADLVCRQNPAVAGLGALAELDFDHLHLRAARLLGEALRVEVAVCGAATKVAAADFPDQVAAMLAVVRADAALAGVMGKAAKACALVECGNRVGTERAKAHGRDVEDRRAIGLAALWPADGNAERCRVGCGDRHHRVADEFEARLVGIVERAEGFLGALVLGPGIHQRTLRTGERQLVIVTFDQVLADLGADGFDQVADVAQDRVVAPHRVVALAQVVEADQAEQGGNHRQRPEPTVLGKKRNAGEGEQQAQGQAGITAGERIFHGSIAGWMTRPRIGKPQVGKTWGFGKRLLPCEHFCLA